MLNGQLYQDFAAALVIGEEGFFVDIGAGWGGANKPPMPYLSNTFFLEDEGNWSGIAIDYDTEYCSIATQKRSCKVICVDLMKNNINDVLDSSGCPKIIDYLSMDVDAAQDKVFDEFDWDNRKCRFITIEHNLYYAVGPNYSPDPKSRKEALSFYDKSRKRLKSLGYKLISSNVSIETIGPVEDWYIHPDLCEKEKYQWLDLTENLTKAELMEKAQGYYDDLTSLVGKK